LKSNTAIGQETKNSLAGRLCQLREESIRQALLRLVRETIPTNSDAPRVIDNAYALRSEIIHNGMPADLDADLEAEGRAVAAVIRDIYASLLKQKLVRPSVC
jgi:hypothetical protein